MVLMLSRLKTVKICAKLNWNPYSQDKPFFPALISYMVSGPVVAMVWQVRDRLPDSLD